MFLVNFAFFAFPNFCARKPKNTLVFFAVTALLRLNRILVFNKIWPQIYLTQLCHWGFGPNSNLNSAGIFSIVCGNLTLFPPRLGPDQHPLWSKFSFFLIWYIIIFLNIQQISAQTLLWYASWFEASSHFLTKVFSQFPTDICSDMYLGFRHSYLRSGLEKTRVGRNMSLEIQRWHSYFLTKVAPPISNRYLLLICSDILPSDWLLGPLLGFKSQRTIFRKYGFTIFFYTCCTDMTHSDIMMTKLKYVKCCWCQILKYVKYCFPNLHWSHGNTLEVEDCEFVPDSDHHPTSDQL